MDKAQIFIAAQKAAKGARHANYKRTVDYANKLKALVTGDSDAVEELVSQFVRRESLAEFDQRKRITRLVSPEVCNRIEVPFKKASRADGISLSIFDKAGKAIEKPDTLTKNFYGKKTVKRYLDEIVAPVRRTDPNAFLVIEFGEFDANVEKPKTFPIIFKSKDVFDFSYVQDALQYVTVGSGSRVTTYFVGGSFTFDLLEDGMTTFTSDDVIEYSAIAETLQSDSRLAGERNPGAIIKIEGKTFRVREYDNGSGLIQAARIGYAYDERTDGAICVSHIHPAINRIERAIIANSESDLSHALHAFPQKIMQARPCPGHSDTDNEGHTVHHECASGFVPGTNETCGRCGGTGLDIMHTSAQDVVMVEFGRGDAQPDLDNVVKYVAVDIETPKYLEEFIEKQFESAMKAVFAGNHFTTMTGAQTATEVKVDYESVYDAVSTYNSQTEQLFEFCVQTRGAFIDMPVEADYRFPKDLGIQSMTDLIGDYKTATDSGAPMELVHAIRKRIITKQYSDQPSALLKAEVLMQHEPFASKSQTAIQYIVAQGLGPRREIVKWANFETLISRIEKKPEYKDFYSMTFEKREEIIESELTALMEEINPSQPL